MEVFAGGVAAKSMALNAEEAVLLLSAARKQLLECLTKLGLQQNRAYNSNKKIRREVK